MLSKNIFIKYISYYQNFNEGIDRLSEALSGILLFECDWLMSTRKIFDLFLQSNFTEEGCDLIYWWLFDKVIYEKPQQLDFFGEFKEGEDIAISVRTIEELWAYIEKNKNDYLL